MKPECSLPHSQHLATVPILSHINSVHGPPSHFLKIHVNTIFQSMPSSFKQPLPPQVSPPKPCMPSCPPVRAARLAHFILLDLITQLPFGEQYRSLCSLPHSPVTLSLLSLNIFLGTLSDKFTTLQ